jgi:hypothetical protein
VVALLFSTIHIIYLGYYFKRDKVHEFWPDYLRGVNVLLVTRSKRSRRVAELMGIVERLGGVEPKEYKGEELPSIEKLLHATILSPHFTPSKLQL